MTEDEAKTKACFRAATFGGSQQLAEGPGPHCIGSACMGWRWVFEPDGTFNATYDTRGEWREVERIPNFRKTDRGFCGPAGAPQ